MNLQAFRLLGIILVELERAGDALNAFLTALDLDPERADEMTTYIASVSTFFCEIPQDVLKKIKGNINKLLKSTLNSLSEPKASYFLERVKFRFVHSFSK